MKLEATAPLARYVGAMLALMLVVSGAVRAEPVFSFDATPGKLPKTVVPISYSIELRPDAENLALPGVEVIDIEVREPTARLTLNPVNTTFASVTADDGADQATSGGRVMAGRAQEVIAISADLKSRALPAVEAWIRERK